MAPHGRYATIDHPSLHTPYRLPEAELSEEIPVSPPGLYYDSINLVRTKQPNHPSYDQHNAACAIRFSPQLVSVLTAHAACHGPPFLNKCMPSYVV